MSITVLLALLSVAQPAEAALRFSDSREGPMETIAAQPGSAGVELVHEFKFGPDTIRKYRLGNGLTIIVMEDHQAPVAAFQTWFSVGSGDEEAGRTGIAHLFEHLMFKETRNLAAGEFDRLLELNGVSTNAATWLDWTYYRENLPSSKLELVMKLEADRMENMILSQEQLDTEREVVVNERKLRVDNDPEGKLYEVLYDLHFGGHPYGHPTLGWMQDIEAIELADCIRFYRLYYAPNNATLVVVGDVDTDRVVELARQLYGHLEAQPLPVAPDPDSDRRKTEHIEILELPLAAPKVVLLYDAPPLSAPDNTPFRVLNEVMFNSESARVRRVLVDEEELATDLGAWYSGFKHGGAFEIQLNLAPGADWRKAVDLLDREVERLTKDGCTDRETAMGVNKNEMAFLRTSMVASSRARNFGHFEVTSGDYRDFFALADKVKKVTAEEVQATAGRYLKQEGRTVVVALPKGSPE